MLIYSCICSYKLIHTYHQEEDEKQAELQAIIDAEQAELMAQENKEKDRERGYFANLRTKVY